MTEQSSPSNPTCDDGHSTNSNPPLPDFITELNVQQQTLIKAIWNIDTLTLSEKIACIDELSDNMTEETRREYRRWRFQHDKSPVNSFLEKQKPIMQNLIRLCLSSQSNLDEFYNSMHALLPSFDDKEAFINWAKSEMLQCDKILFYMIYGEDPNYEGRICLFNSNTFEVKIVKKFSTWALANGVATGNDQIFLMDWHKQVFEIFNYETKQLTKGPNPPEWREGATIAYYKNKLYYIGGWDSNIRRSSCVNVLVNGKWQRGPDFPIDISFARHAICNDELYIISHEAAFQLSDDEQKWMEVRQMKEGQWSAAVASLNGKIYITGGYDNGVLNSCLCFDPSQPSDRQFISIANMHFNRYNHSLVVANEKLYAIGGYGGSFCKSVEEYDPTTNQWKILIMTEQSSSPNPTYDDDFSTNPVDPNSLLPDFITGLNAQQQTLIKDALNSDTLTLREKIACMDALEDEMSEETRREYRRWRFQHDKSPVNSFLEKQKPIMQNLIRLCLSSQSNLDEFYNSMHALLPSFDDKEAFLNWAKSEMCNKILFYLRYNENSNYEGRICLFNSSTFEVEIVKKFSTCGDPCQVTIGNDQILLINGWDKVFEIFNYETKQLTKGPNPPEWRDGACIAYYKNKLYYIGGEISYSRHSNYVNILVNGKWKRRPDLPMPVKFDRHAICNNKLYIVCENYIFQLSNDERKWIKVGKMGEMRFRPAVASLNGKIYITGGRESGNIFNSCLCFDPRQPSDRRFTTIANMHFNRYGHSLVVANEKLYAIGGYGGSFCKSVEEYDPTTNQWKISNNNLLNRKSLSINDTKSSDIPSHNGNKTILSMPNYHQNEKILFYLFYGEYPYKGRICLFNSSTFEVEIVNEFSTYGFLCEVTKGEDKIFLINGDKKVFEIFNYETKQLAKGPDPPKWRHGATVAYYKNKLYYIGGEDSNEDPTSCVNILVNGKWQRGTDFPMKLEFANHVICNDKLYIIYEDAVFQLSEDEREWFEVGKMEKERGNPAVASLNGKIYITGGKEGFNIFNYNILNSCLCFDLDPSQPSDRRFTSIASMNYKRCIHSLVVANGRLYAIGGYQEDHPNTFCKSIEEYDPATDSWRIVGEIE